MSSNIFTQSLFKYAFDSIDPNDIELRIAFNIKPRKLKINSEFIKKLNRIYKNRYDSMKAYKTDSGIPWSGEFIILENGTFTLEVWPFKNNSLGLIFNKFTKTSNIYSDPYDYHTGLILNDDNFITGPSEW